MSVNDFLYYVDDVVDKLTNYSERKDGQSSAVEELQEYYDSLDKEMEIPTETELEEVPTYERLEYESLTDAEIEAQAESLLADYLNSGTTSIENEYANKGEDLASDKESVIVSAESATQGVESAYENAAQEVDNDVLKRGLARSSIAVNQQSALSSAKASTISSITIALENSINEIESQINSLETDLEKALDDFNITYATKLAESILELKEAQQEKMEEAIKYNNSLTETEFEQSIDREEASSDIYSQDLDNAEKYNELIATTEEEVSEKMYEQAVLVLGALPQSDARDLVLNNTFIMNSMNDYYYSKLYNMFVGS